MYEPVLVDEKLDLYNVYEIHENYRILAMAVNVPLQVAEEICHILNEFEIKSLCEEAVRYLQMNYESMIGRGEE